MSGNTITIASDHIEAANGEHLQFKKMLERESNGQRYLVFQLENGREELMKIIDDDTLEQDNGFMKTVLHRK